MTLRSKAVSREGFSVANEFTRDLISGNEQFTEPTPQATLDPRGPTTGERRAMKSSAFSQALHRVEQRRSLVRGAMALALAGRLLVDFDLLALLRAPSAALEAVPHIGLALLAYLIVLWFLAARTRDRFGFGMALGIGVLHGTFVLGSLATLRPLTVQAAWPAACVALAHFLMAAAAFYASGAYPPHDSKRPWLVGFVTALAFLAVPWVSPF